MWEGGCGDVDERKWGGLGRGGRLEQRGHVPELVGRRWWSGIAVEEGMGHDWYGRMAVAAGGGLRVVGCVFRRRESRGSGKKTLCASSMTELFPLPSPNPRQSSLGSKARPLHHLTRLKSHLHQAERLIEICVNCYLLARVFLLPPSKQDVIAPSLFLSTPDPFRCQIPTTPINNASHL